MQTAECLLPRLGYDGYAAEKDVRIVIALILPYRVHNGVSLPGVRSAAAGRFRDATFL